MAAVPAVASQLGRLALRAPADLERKARPARGHTGPPPRELAPILRRWERGRLALSLGLGLGGKKQLRVTQPQLLRAEAGRRPTSALSSTFK